MTLSLTAAPTLPDLNDPATFNTRALSIFSWMTGTFIDELEAIEASDYFSVQSSVTDTTSGVLMLNGAFGLGTLASSAHLTSYSDAGGVSQFVGDGKTATPADKPETGKAHAGLHVAATSDRWMQLLARVAGTGFASEKLYFRRNHDGTVSDWRLMYHQGTIIGTVSQSGGVPTEAVFEKPASSANGWTRKVADGYRKDWHVLTTSTGAGVTWTFPGGAFVAAPNIQITPIGTAAVDVMMDASPSTTSVTISARDTAGARVAVSVHLQATERWSALT